MFTSTSPPVAAGSTTGSIALFNANCRGSTCAAKLGTPTVLGKVPTLAMKKLLTEAPCGSVAVTSMVTSVCLCAATAWTCTLAPLAITAGAPG